MILVLKYANELQLFLQKKVDSGIIEKFKIFVRIGFQLDAYIFTDCQNSQTIESEFFKYVTDKYAKDSIDPQKIRIYFNILPLSELEDSYYSNIVSNANTIDLGPHYRLDSIIGDNTAKKDDSLPPIITFYSYKGGVGRTTSMVSYAIHLAKKGKAVAVIDCDLEAPGYINFFNLSEDEILGKGEKNGIVEFICDTQFKGTDVNISNYIINIYDSLNISKDSAILGQKYPELGNIWLVPAGNLNGSPDDPTYSYNRDHYLEGLSKLNLGNTSSVIEGFNRLFRQLQSIGCEVILIDSRTGFNDIFGTAVLHLSKCVVGFFGYSKQNEPGFFHLLTKYNQSENPFKLKIAYSILPEDEDESSSSLKRMQNFIIKICNEKEIPPYFLIHRNPVLEKLGTADKKNDEQFIEKNSSSEEKDQFDDYKRLFEELDDTLWPPKVAETIELESTENTDDPERKNGILDLSINTPAIKLRNIILRHLKNVLTNVTNFAEDTTIEEKTFFYRKCMKELFNRDAFIIQGYKGTGKTYLYRALKDESISKELQKWAGVNDGKKYVFINILASKKDEPSFPFKNIAYSKIEESEYYFNCFWQIYTWNKLLLDDGNTDLKSIRESIRAKSKLSQEVLPIDGQAAKIRFDRLIDDDKTLLYIEEDLKAFNEELEKKNINIIALYDRLDTYINPLHWNKAVSPLIDYWQNYYTYSNIYPKIFVRTDLFKQIEGTNTARLSNNIINIEWTIEEVFAYFFKLIFSDSNASDAYWILAHQMGINDQYIRSTQLLFGDTNNHKQFKSLKRAEMDPVVYIFFGKIVRGRLGSLGKPWDYFGNELANADNKSISLRPFINTLNKNAVDKALGTAVSNVTEIISSEIYASREVRDFATNQYFDDLARDEFSKDLYKFKEVIRTAGGEKYRYKTLNETNFEDLMADTFRRIGDSSSSVKSITDLKSLIFANGIMAETITTRGRFYKFAPIYWYAWGLKDEPIKFNNQYTPLKVQLTKTIQPPIKAQVFKPDEAILARIKRSQQQAQSRRFSGTFNTKPQSPKPPQNTDDDNMPF
ncbi:KGGVGR-motif variant AAA ATPase [Fibrobacter sp.]|uniref:KGGVGR-motif variant AAA ATPase n=1 Tax=Fibrobacter sp. TaxID=35828 RepID=UPI00389031B0